MEDWNIEYKVINRTLMELPQQHFQFQQPIGANHKYKGAQSLAQKMPSSFTNNTMLNFNRPHK